MKPLHLLLTALVWLVSLPAAAGDIPCRSGLKSDTYQFELDKIACRRICPDEICGGQAAWMIPKIYGEIDKYQIDCRCGSWENGGNAGSTGSAGTGSYGSREPFAGTCSFGENRNGAFNPGFEVVYGSSRRDITETCSWLCRDGRRRNCRITEWFE